MGCLEQWNEENPCAIKDNFEKTTRKHKGCKKCKIETNTDDIHNVITMNIPHEHKDPKTFISTDLVEQQYSATERVTYNCNHCNGSESIITNSLIRLPPILVFHLACFDYNNDKLQCSVSVPKNINLGILNHHGQGTRNGHYTSDYFDFNDNRWKHFDNLIEYEVTEREVIEKRTESAYTFCFM